MNIKQLILLIFSFPSFVFADNREQQDPTLESLLSMDLEMLGQVQVYTASRQLTEIDDTSAVVTVITAEDIARRGYRSIYDVIEQVPGHYYNVSSQFENLTSRGISQTLTSFLLLIDGHAVNNRSGFGISVETVFPNLSDVERIEVVRGSGTVLWGTEAGLGIIHVITKWGRSLDATGEGRLELFVDYETDHNRKIASAVYGKRFEQGDLMASFKHFDSNAPFGEGFQSQFGANTQPVSTNRFNANWDFDPSHEFSLKGRWQDFGLKSQVTRFNNHSFDNSQLTEAEYYRNWIELTWSPQITDRTRLESRVYYNNFETIYRHPRDQFDDIYTMQGGGAEAVFYFNFDDFDVIAGANTEIHYLEIDSGFGTADGKPLSLAPKTKDVQLALFGEGIYKGIVDWQFTLGARLQNNGGILDGTQFLPRTAAIYTINQNWTVKYVYNRSEVAPSMELWRDGIDGQLIDRLVPVAVAGAENPQRYDIHDLQLSYKGEQTAVTASLFNIDVKDMIQFFNGAVTLPDGSSGRQRWFNGPDATSKGLQVEFSHQKDITKFYGDYTYADAKFNERFFSFQGTTVDIVVDRAIADQSLNLINSPEHAWNLGSDIEISPYLSLNLHYRGYSQLQMKFAKLPSLTFKDLGPEHFFDASLLWRDAGLDNLEFSIYVKNFTNNKAVVPDTVNGGFAENVLERRVGLSLKYNF